MKLLWHSVDPRLTTAYALQTRYALDILVDLPLYLAELPQLELALSAYYGETRPYSEQVLEDPEQTVLPVYGNPHASADPWGALSLERAVRHWKPDAVVMLMDAHVAPIEAATAWGVPVLLWTPIDHDPMPDSSWSRADAASLVASPSRNGVKLMRARSGLDPLYIPHVAADVFFHPPDQPDSRRELSMDPAWFVFGMVGANLGVPPRKGFVEAIEAFSRVVEAGADYARLFLWTDANPPWPNTVNLIEVAKHFGVEDLVFQPSRELMLFGYSSHRDLAKIYATMDCLIAPSYGEGFNVPIAEAMAASVPIIAPRHTGMLDWDGGIELTGGQPHYTGRGSFFQRPNIDELTAAMAAMIKLPDPKRQEMGALAHATARKEYIHDAASPYWADAIRRLVELAAGEDRNDDDEG